MVVSIHDTVVAVSTRLGETCDTTANDEDMLLQRPSWHCRISHKTTKNVCSEWGAEWWYYTVVAVGTDLVNRDGKGLGAAVGAGAVVDQADQRTVQRVARFVLLHKVPPLRPVQLTMA